MKPVMWSFGMQSRPIFHVGDDPDIEGAVQAAADAGMKDAIIFGKDHSGLCMHPTKYGVQHPHIKIDLTGEMTAALHRRNMRAIAYFNFGMDGEMGRRKPEWLQQHAPGVVTTTVDHYADICIFDEYLHDYAIPIMLEMFEKYKIDGLFLDTMSAFHYCCCPKCRAAFEKDNNMPLPLPENPEDPAWNIYGPWQYQRAENVMNYVRNTIMDKYPDAEIIFNHVGGPGVPYPFPGVETGIVSCDPPAFYPWVTLYANYLNALEHGGDVFIERFARGWGDRCDLEDRTLKYKCAAIFAHRQRYCVGDRMHPDGRLAPGSEHAMKIITDVWKQFSKALPEHLSRNYDYIYLLSESRCCGKNREKYASPFRDMKKTYDPLIGTLRMLMDSGCSFQVVPEFALKRNLKPGKVVIVSGVDFLRAETDALLEEYVRNGGKVLFCGKIPVRDDGSLPEYCGVISAKDSIHTCVFLPGRVTGARTLVRGIVQKLELADNTKSQLFGYPQQYAEKVSESPYPYYNAAGETPMEIPLLTSFRYGKGCSWFLNCGVMEDYYDTALPAQMEWTRHLLQSVIQKPEVCLKSESGNVELVAYDDVADEKVCVLINHGGRENSLKCNYITEHISSPQPAYQVELRVLSNDDKLEAKVGSRVLRPVRRGKYQVFSITLDSTWKFIRIKSVK